MPIALNSVTTKTYFIFGSIFFCAAPFVWYFIPETKGLSLEYIDRLFDSSKRTGAGHVNEDNMPTLNSSGMDEDKPVIQYLENAAEQKLAPVKE